MRQTTKNNMEGEYGILITFLTYQPNLKDFLMLKSEITKYV
jgi:hypothetical protein